MEEERTVFCTESLSSSSYHLIVRKKKRKRSKIIRPHRALARKPPNNAKSEPYKFMGRTVKEKHVFDSRMANEFALDVVSEETGVSRDDLKKTFGSLKSLLPEVSSSSLRVTRTRIERRWI